MNRPLILLAIVAAFTMPLRASAQFTGVIRSQAPYISMTLVSKTTGVAVAARDLRGKFRVKRTGVMIEDDTTLPDNTLIENVDTKEVFVAYAPRRFVQLGAYVASFGIAGPIQQSDGSFRGGTSSANNPLLSLDVGIPLRPHDGTLSVGGWYFFSPDGSEFDVYQTQVKYGLRHNSPFGGQVAYLNNTHGDAQTFTFHVTYTLNSAMLAPAQKPWGVEFGFGILNATNRQPLDAGGARDRNTIDPSVFVNANWTILPRTSLLATLWSVRNRNTDITRLGLGIAYRF